MPSKYETDKFMNDVVDFVAENYQPDEVFTREQLIQWCYDEGLIEEEEQNA